MITYLEEYRAKTGPFVSKALVLQWRLFSPKAPKIGNSWAGPSSVGTYL